MGHDNAADDGTTAAWGCSVRSTLLALSLAVAAALLGRALEASAQATPTPTPTPTAPAGGPTPVAAGSTIAGIVFEDEDGDEIRDTDEVGRGGVTVALRTRGGGDPGRRQTTTNAGGLFEFSGLAPGEYRLDIDAPAGFRSERDGADVTVARPGETAQVNFGLARQPGPTPTPAARLSPQPSPAPATPIAPAPAGSPAAKPTGAPAPRAGGFPMELALPLLAGGGAAVGTGAYLLRRGRGR
jgi:SdrD B-like domain